MSKAKHNEKVGAASEAPRANKITGHPKVPINKCPICKPYVHEYATHLPETDICDASEAPRIPGHDASYASPCRADMDNINAFYERTKSKGGHCRTELDLCETPSAPPAKPAHQFVTDPNVDPDCQHCDECGEPKSAHDKPAHAPGREHDGNSTYCEECGCRITAGRCKHGVLAPWLVVADDKSFEVVSETAAERDRLVAQLAQRDKDYLGCFEIREQYKRERDRLREQVKELLAALHAIVEIESYAGDVMQLVAQAAIAKTTAAAGQAEGRAS